MDGNNNGRAGSALSDMVYVSQPTPDKKPRTASDPTLIIIFGWMDGRLQHVLKYAQAYEKHYPAATLLVISSRSDFWWSGPKKREAALSPAVGWLKENDFDFVSGVSNQRILLHSFSNGGCFQLTTLAAILSQKRARKGIASTTPIIPAKALVFDSCPGDSSLRAGVAAFTAGIRNSLVRLFAMALVGTILGIWKLVATLLCRQDPFSKLALDTANPKYFPVDASRLYIYSMMDQMVRHQAVEGHVKSASKVVGEQNVRVEKYTNSPHVSHMKTDPSRYWGAIQKLWLDVSQEDR